MEGIPGSPASPEKVISANTTEHSFCRHEKKYRSLKKGEGNVHCHAVMLRQQILLPGTRHCRGLCAVFRLFRRRNGGAIRAVAAGSESVA
jgi:hypothetical protein